MSARIDRAALLAGLLVAAALAFDALRPVASYDAWFHVATGQEIWAQGGPLVTDTFSYTHAGAPWPWQDWLADLVIAGFASGGAGGLVVFKALCFALTVALISVSLWRGVASEVRAPARAGLVVAGAAIATGGLSFRMLERPEALGYVLLAWLFLELDAWRRTSEDGEACGYRHWRVLGIVLLNAQVHRGVIVLPVVLLAFAVSMHVEGRRASMGLQPWFIFVLSTLALLVTPYGLAIFGTSDALLSEYGAMQEFSAPSLELLWALSPWTLWIIAASLAALFALVRRGVTAHVWELACVLMGLVLLSRGLRFAAFLPLFVALPLARCWPQRWDRAAAGTSLLLSIGLLVGVLRSPLPGPQLGVASDHHPVTGIEFVKAQRSRGYLRGRVFNVSAYGGYLLAELERELPVYVDGRVDLVYPPEFMRASAEAMVDPRVFRAEQDRWGFDWLFIDNAPHLQAQGHFDMHPDFGLVHASARALVYVRTSGPDAQLFEEQGYKIIKPHFIAQSVEQGLANPATRGQTVAEVLRMYEQDPDNMIAQVARARLVQGGLVEANAR